MTEMNLDLSFTDAKRIATADLVATIRSNWKTKEITASSDMELITSAARLLNQTRTEQSLLQDIFEFYNQYHK